jgi:hypothetical protein
VEYYMIWTHDCLEPGEGIFTLPHVAPILNSTSA